MLSQSVMLLFPSTVNPFPRGLNSDYSNFSEQNSIFENVIEDMKGMKQTSASNCNNPNCKTFFFIYTNCASCHNRFCNKCMTKCEKCHIQICKICSITRYEKYKDSIVCSQCQ